MIRPIVLGVTLAWLAPLAVVAPATDGSPTCPPPTTFCDPGCYTLGNKVTGQVAPPNYGLRLDGLFGNASDHWTFDFEAPGTGVEMCHDGVGTITVDGIAFGGLDIGGQWDANETSFVEIHFVWQNASCENGELLVLESNDGFGYGTVEWLNTGEVFTFSGKANGAGEVFLFDGSSGRDARGWVQWGNGLAGDFSMTVTANDHCLPEPDCDGDGVSDGQEVDCNGNGIPDDCEELADCNGNGVPDSCDIAAGMSDANGNGVPDVCEPGIEVYCVPDPQDPETASCPCGNDPIPGVIGGCVNASGGSATLLTSGSPSVVAGDLVLEASGIPLNRPGVFFAGPQPESAGMGTPFRNGLLCISGPLVRIEKIRQSPGGQASYPGPGFPSLAQTLGVLPGDTTYFQFWYRDPGGACLGGAANTTNAIRVTWGE